MRYVLTSFVNEENLKEDLFHPRRIAIGQHAVNQELIRSSITLGV